MPSFVARSMALVRSTFSTKKAAVSDAEVVSDDSGFDSAAVVEPSTSTRQGSKDISTEVVEDTGAPGSSEASCVERFQLRRSPSSEVPLDQSGSKNSQSSEVFHKSQSSGGVGDGALSFEKPAAQEGQRVHESSEMPGSLSEIPQVEEAPVAQPPTKPPRAPPPRMLVRTDERSAGAFDGRWVLVNETPDTAKWLRSLNIDGLTVVDAEGKRLIIVPGKSQGMCLCGGVLEIRGESLVRRGKTGRVQVYIRDRNGVDRS